MFLRKLLVIAVPLLLCLAVCLLLPLFAALGLMREILGGAVMGIALALLLPLSGAVRRREPFGALLWVPAAVLSLVILSQLLRAQGIWQSGFLRIFATTDGNVILTESAFAGFMLATCIRTIGG